MSFSAAWKEFILLFIQLEKYGRVLAFFIGSQTDTKKLLEISFLIKM